MCSRFGDIEVITKGPVRKGLDGKSGGGVKLVQTMSKDGQNG